MRRWLGIPFRAVLGLIFTMIFIFPAITDETENGAEAWKSIKGIWVEYVWEFK